MTDTIELKTGLVIEVEYEYEPEAPEVGLGEIYNIFSARLIAGDLADLIQFVDRRGTIASLLRKKQVREYEYSM